MAFDSPLTPDVLAADDLFGILSNQRRRFVLQSLGETGTPMGFDELVDDVAEREHGMPISDIPAEEVDRVRLSLYHSHVPKLDGANLVEFRAKREQVSLSVNSEQVEALLELVTQSQ